MITYYKLSNFRTFDSEGTYVDISPITILTGCNNSGKSSITKSLCLLNDFCQQLRADIDDGKKMHLGSYKMDFHKHPFDLLGSFNHVVNKESDNDTVTLELIAESNFLLQDVKVSMTLGAIPDDDLCNGYLLSYSISTMDDIVIFSSTRGKGYYMNLAPVKKNLLLFLYSQCALAHWQDICAFSSATVSSLDNNCQEGQDLDYAYKLLCDNLGAIGVIGMFEWQLSQSRHSWKEGCIGNASSILTARDSSFFKSAEYGVYCFIPVMEKLCKIEKPDFEKTVREQLTEKECKLTSFEEGLLRLLFSAFRNGEDENIIDLVSRFENEELFKQSNTQSIGGVEFSSPSVWGSMRIGKLIYDETDLPDKADWQCILLALDILNRHLMPFGKSYVYEDEINCNYAYTFQGELDEIFSKIIENIWIQLIPGSIHYTGTSAVSSQRLYSLAEDNELVASLKHYFEVKRMWANLKANCTQKDKYVAGSFINTWMAKFGLAHHVEIKTHVEGYGVTVHLYDSDKDKQGMLLADKGYGAIQMFSILLKIENAIIESYFESNRHVYAQLGISTQLLENLRPYNTVHPITVALEEPENHLHPSMQSKLAEMMVNAYCEFGIHFMVETHSEYMIRKFQTFVGAKIMSAKDLSLLYVYDKESRPRDNDGRPIEPQLYRIFINEDGSLDRPFGKGFFDETDSLVSDLFNLKLQNDGKA